MQRIINILTLKTVSISVYRKRIFILTVLLLTALLVTPQLSFKLIFPLPYTVEVLRLVTLITATNVIASTIRILIVSSHRKRRGITNKETDNFTVGLNALVTAITVLSGIIFFFLVFDIEFRTFLNSIALFAVALTLIFIDFIKNFLYGLAVMFSDDYEIGDYIQVGDMTKGVIVSLTFSAVHLKTVSGDMLYIPNSSIRSHEVINFSKLKSKIITTEFRMLRTQLSTVAPFEQALITFLDSEFPNTFDTDKTYIQIKETTLDEVVFTLEAPTKKASLSLKKKVAATVQTFAFEYNQKK